MPEHNDRGRGGGRRIFVWAIALVVLCVVGGLLASVFFQGATITVYPRQATVTAPATLTAGLDAPVGSLSYQLMNVSKSAQQTAPANGTQPVSSVAQGTITIYNDYSTSPQTLIARTRFETPDGKIYRTRQEVKVPGGTKNADGTLTSGQVTATVWADEPGSSYNIGATKFTIPGFEGTPRYKSFYADTQGISGGASGTEPAVASADLQNAQTAMQQDFASSLPSAAAAQVPDGFIAIPGTLAISYGAPQIGSASGGNATITEAATATEAIIRTADLANAIAKQEVQGYGGEAIDFADPTKLQLTLASSTAYSADTTTITLVPAGVMTLVWQFDPTKLQQALAGKSKSEFDSIVKTFAPAIAKATASLRPFWKSSFPSNPASIQVKTVNPS